MLGCRETLSVFYCCNIVSEDALAWDQQCTLGITTPQFMGTDSAPILEMPLCQEMRTQGTKWNELWTASLCHPGIKHSSGRVRQNWLSRANQSPRPKKAFKVPGCTWSRVGYECPTSWGGENSCNEFQRCHEQSKYPTTWDWIINDAAPQWMTRYPENWLDQGTQVV